MRNTMEKTNGYGTRKMLSTKWRNIFEARRLIWTEIDEGCKTWCTDILSGCRVSLMNRTARLNGVQVVWVHNKKVAGVEVKSFGEENQRLSVGYEEPYSTG